MNALDVAPRYDLDVLAVGEVMGLLDPEQPGPLEDVANFALRVAGAETNALITLSRLQAATALISAVGDDPIGRLVLRTVAEMGVDTSWVQEVRERATGVFFKERFPDGVRRVYYYRKDSAAANLRWSDLQVETLPTPRVFLLSGLSLGIGRPDGMSDVAVRAIKEMSARGATVVFDANTRPELWDGETAREDFARLRDDIDVLLAGEEELETLCPPGGAAAATGLCARGIQAVFVKAGHRGATLYEPGQVVTLPPYRHVQVVDSIGAGDAFAAGVVAGILRGWPMPRSGQLGARLGAAAVASTGDWEAIPEFSTAESLLGEYLDALDRPPTAPEHEEEVHASVE